MNESTKPRVIDLSGDETGDVCEPGGACFGSAGHGAVRLWDEETNSVVGSYESQDAAIAQVREWVALGEEAFVRGLVLLRVHDGGCAQRPIRGRELLLLADPTLSVPG